MSGKGGNTHNRHIGSNKIVLNQTKPRSLGILNVENMPILVEAASASDSNTAADILKNAVSSE